MGADQQRSEPATDRRNPRLVPTRSGPDLLGDLLVPDQALGLVVFAHGSGSGRRSTRNRVVAEHLRRHGLATLLLDLLSADEEERDALTAELRFDVRRLGERVVDAIDWAAGHPSVGSLPVGLFGASTGAAAALVAATARPGRVRAVVSRGGRPDLAGPVLADVQAPTLLIVGGADSQTVEHNRRVVARLACTHRFDIVPAAGHLFEEPGALGVVAAKAADWFGRYLGEEPDPTT